LEVWKVKYEWNPSQSRQSDAELVTDMRPAHTRLMRQKTSVYLFVARTMVTKRRYGVLLYR
jgi:hypothetical protein